VNDLERIELLEELLVRVRKNRRDGKFGAAEGEAVPPRDSVLDAAEPREVATLRAGDKPAGERFDDALGSRRSEELAADAASLAASAAHPVSAEGDAEGDEEPTPVSLAAHALPGASVLVPEIIPRAAVVTSVPREVEPSSERTPIAFEDVPFAVEVRAAEVEPSSERTPIAFEDVPLAVEIRAAEAVEVALPSFEDVPLAVEVAAPSFEDVKPSSERTPVSLDDGSFEAPVLSPDWLDGHLAIPSPSSIPSDLIDIISEEDMGPHGTQLLISGEVEPFASTRPGEPQAAPLFDDERELPTVSPPSSERSTLIPAPLQLGAQLDEPARDSEAEFDAFDDDPRFRQETPELMGFVPLNVPPAAASRVIAREVEASALMRQDTQPSLEDAYDLVGYVGKPSPAFPDRFGDVLDLALGLELRS